MDNRDEYYEFKTNFSDDQGIRMRETIINEPEFESILNLLADGTADVAVLYEPYVNEYFNIGPNLPNHKPLFQPGFDYTFIQCGGNVNNYAIEIYNEPTDYDDTSFYFETDATTINFIDKYSLEFNDITHPNHSAIYIEQLNEFSIRDGGLPHKCYNNFNRNASNGTIIKYEDNYPNTNVTIQQKNEAQINDANLIQSLENGLYIIKKNYSDGTQEQKTVLKNNN